MSAPPRTLRVRPISRKAKMKRLTLCLLPLVLAGCILPPAVSVVSLVLDGMSYATTGKSVTDHVISGIAGSDCALMYVIEDGQLCNDEPVMVASDEPGSAVALAAIAASRLPGTLPPSRRGVADQASLQASALAALDERYLDGDVSEYFKLFGGAAGFLGAGDVPRAGTGQGRLWTAGLPGGTAVAAVDDRGQRGGWWVRAWAATCSPGDSCSYYVPPGSGAPACPPGGCVPVEAPDTNSSKPFSGGGLKGGWDR